MEATSAQGDEVPMSAPPSPPPPLPPKDYERQMSQTAASPQDSKELRSQVVAPPQTNARQILQSTQVHERWMSKDAALSRLYKRLISEVAAPPEVYDITDKIKELKSSVPFIFTY